MLKRTLHDPLLDGEEPDSLVLQGQYPGLEAILHSSRKCGLWLAQQVDFTVDRKTWQKLTPRYRHFLEVIFAWFAFADKMVMTNVGDNFADEARSSAVTVLFYAFMFFNESVHAESYGLAMSAMMGIDRLREVEREAKSLSGRFACVLNKRRWVEEHLDKNKYSFAHRLLAGSIIEQVFFSGSFCSMFFVGVDPNVNAAGGLVGATMMNAYVVRDESNHVQFAAELHRNLREKLSEEEFQLMVRSAVEVEKEFVVNALSGEGLTGLTVDGVSRYVECVADTLAVMLGFRRPFNTDNPFPWTQIGFTTNSTDFFSRRPPEYAHATSGLAPLGSSSVSHCAVSAENSQRVVASTRGLISCGDEDAD